MRSCYSLAEVHKAKFFSFQTQMKDLKKKLNALMQVCSHLMVGNQPRTQEEAYVTICDTLIMFRCAFLLVRDPHKLRKFELA